MALWNARKTPGVDAADGALIFPGRDGGFLGRARMYRVVKAAAKTAGVPWAGLHTLRHTCATILFRHSSMSYAEAPMTTARLISANRQSRRRRKSHSPAKSGRGT